jgi:hypothetical protein
MDWVFIEEEMEYDGSQLASLWAFRNLGIKDDCIVAFIGRCDVKPDHMVDLEDRVGGERIYSPRMLHFIVEHFDEISMKLIATRQRLLVYMVKDVIGREIEIRGSDMYWNGKKLSVSVATISPVSAKIHLGINIESDEYASLTEMGVYDIQRIAFEACSLYSKEILKIEEDIRKTRPVEAI